MVVLAADRLVKPFEAGLFAVEPGFCLLEHLHDLIEPSVLQHYLDDGGVVWRVVLAHGQLAVEQGIGECIGVASDITLDLCR